MVSDNSNGPIRASRTWLDILTSAPVSQLRIFTVPWLHDALFCIGRSCHVRVCNIRVYVHSVCFCDMHGLLSSFETKSKHN